VLVRVLAIAVVVAAVSGVAPASTAAHPYWGQTRAGAENSIREYRWDDQQPANVRCKGIWAGAERRGDTYLFQHLWCELQLRDGYWHFKYHQLGRTNFKTTDWTCGHIGTNPCGRGHGGGSASSGSGGGACRANGFSCSIASSVYFAFVARNYTGSWRCQGSAVSGRCENESSLSIDGWAFFNWP
jgi:hypothetical protein